MRLAIVTGASSGIGAATARRLAAEDHRVVMVARRRPKLEAVATEIGHRGSIEPCDAADGEAVLAMAERVLRLHGVPQVIVNGAGAGGWKRVEDTSPAEAASMMQAPYFAAFNVTHAFMRPLLEEGRGVIIHINSPASFAVWPASSGYAAARWALRGLHESLCADLAGTGVRSCHVVFGRVSSPYFEHNPGTADHLPGLAKTIRALSPEECADVITRLARRPRRQVIYPFMLRLYYWNHTLFPWLTRWLLRRTGARRGDCGST
jgi:short-subunit dehydrogenase